MIKLFYVFILLQFVQLSAQSTINKTCENSADPSKTIVAGGSVAEIIYFLNLESYLVAADVTSTYPKQVTELPSIGYVRNLSVEGLLSMHPTLVIGEDDMGPPNVLSQLELVNIDVRIIPEERTIAGIMDKIDCVARVLGEESFAKRQVNKKLKSQISSLSKFKKINSNSGKKGMLILSMRGTSPVVAGAETSGDGFIALTGIENIYSSVDGWKPVTIESIIQQNPDYIFIPQRDVHQNSDIVSLKKNILLQKTSAIKNDNIITDDAMAMLGFSPRTILSALNAAKKISDQK
tara:strand:- start:66 stop:941 length:876 start_codon:yes stop_codon:yes gene_type:complete